MADVQSHLTVRSDVMLMTVGRRFFRGADPSSLEDLTTGTQSRLFPDFTARTHPLRAKTRLDDIAKCAADDTPGAVEH